MKRTDNPFEGLGTRYPQARHCDGSLKQKAFFEHGSYESGLIPFEERLTIMVGFVLDGYDMHKLVKNYLDEKDALKDDRRKYGIAGTFKMYSTILLKNLLAILEEIRISDNLEELIDNFYSKDRHELYKDETASEEMRRRIKEFVNLAKEIYSGEISPRQTTTIP